MPTITLPKLPELKIPELPKFELPKFDLPKVELPDSAAVAERLDALQDRLPPVPAKVLELQRALAAKACEGYSAAWSAVGESYKSFFDTAVTSTKTVTGQARAAGEQVVNTVTTGVKTVAGQAAAQSKKVSDAAETQVVGLVDQAIDAVDDAPSTGTPYEQWTKAELVERAKELKIVGPTRMSKSELIEALRAS